MAPGRRDTLSNRDLGTAHASAGRMLAVVVTATRGTGPPSGWHHRPCDQQLIYVVKGWVEFEIEDGTRTRLDVGGSVLLPGGTRHNVPRTADEIEVLTMTVPATDETVMCDAPPGLS